MMLREGKLPPAVLERLVRYTSSAPEILVGAAVGEDAAVVRGFDTLVITSDPITFTEEEIGTYVVSVNANDIVAMGGSPRYLTTTILAPVGTEEERLERVFARLEAACRRLGLLWVGGHTEVSSAVNRIVVCGHAVGVLEREATGSDRGRPGDALVLTKWAGLEGTTLIARERPRECSDLLGPQRYADVLKWLEEPGISIVPEGRLTARCAISAAHDPTEGGVATGIREIAQRSGLGVVVNLEAVQIREETRVVCRRYGMDPLGLLSSGCFLFGAAPPEAARAAAMLNSSGIDAAVIGTLTQDQELLIQDAGARRPLPSFERDECLKAIG